MERLEKGDDASRGAKIMAASRTADASLLPQLFARLDSDETHENKRHIVRALGNIGGRQAEGKLLSLLRVQRGLMLGDIAEALGKLKSRRAIPLLKPLSNHRLEWVRQCVKSALRRLDVSDS